MKFPDFIIIGAAKCGTTALWMNLDKHPEINMGRKGYSSIEVHFWGYKFGEKVLIGIKTYSMDQYVERKVSIIGLVESL